jgi:phospholipase C
VDLGSAAEKSIVMNLAKQYGWYDFTVKQVGTRTEVRYAGRVETGRSSYSDPAMGDLI